MPGYVVGQDFITNFKLFERYDFGFKTVLPSHEFVKEVHEKIINPYLKELMPEGTKNPIAIKLDKVIDDGGAASVTAVQNHEGTLYNLLKMYTDVGIWNELYLEDDEEGVHVVFRPAPTLKLDGKTRIQSRAPAPKVIPIDIHHVINMTVSRSDANVANYYWVRGPRFDYNSDVYRRLNAVNSADRDTVLLDKYQNTSSKLYGIRAMYGETQTGPNDIFTDNSGLPEAEENARLEEISNWIGVRRKIMVEQNRDNVVLEHGTLRMFGNELVRAGMYINLKRGAFNALYYVTQVDHSFVPFNGFVSTLTFARGLGFVERAKMDSGKQSPWIAERTIRS